MQRAFIFIFIINLVALRSFSAKQNMLRTMQEEEEQRRAKEESELIFEAGCKEKRYKIEMIRIHLNTYGFQVVHC